MRLGTMTSLFFTRRGREDRISYLESVRRCHDAGFRVLDVNLCPLSRRQTTLHLDDWRQQVDEIRNEAEKLGMVFSQSHPPYRGRLDRLETEEDRQYFRSMLLRAIEISAMLGVKWAVLHPETAPGSSCYDLEANIRENQRIYDQELELAHKLGVGLAFENMCDRGQRRRFGCSCRTGSRRKSVSELSAAVLHHSASAELSLFISGTSVLSNHCVSGPFSSDFCSSDLCASAFSAADDTALPHGCSASTASRTRRPLIR